MSSKGWSFSRLQISPPRSLRLQTEGEPPTLPFFEPHSAVVHRPSLIPTSLCLLGIPAEVRDQIWEFILADIHSDQKGVWYDRPSTDYDGLPLVCRQIYHEISNYWRRLIVTQHRLYDFLGQSFSLSKLQGFKSLSIEIPFNMPSEFFINTASMLRYLAHFLEHLSIFFIGQDAYGTKTFLHGCGNKFANSELKKLPIDGQGFKERNVLINALSHLRNLRSLAIHNPNMPLLQSHIILHKPALEKLYIESDPRSSLHIPWRFQNCGRGLLIPVTERFPPVKELHISANAAIMSVQVVSKLNTRLEKLTWICSDISRQAGSMSQDYLRDTDIILNGLRSNTKSIHTLRICIEGAIYESLHAYGVLIGSFKAHLPHLASLRNLELHIWSKSPWLGEEVIYSLPAGLERLYLSERLIDLGDLLYTIEDIYFGVYDLGEQRCAINTTDELTRADTIPLRTGALKFVNYQYLTDAGKRMKVTEVEDRTLQTDSNVKPRSPDTVGKGSSDKISEDIESNPSEDDNNINKTVPPDEARRMALLKVNARLLDRSRNRCLAASPCPEVEIDINSHSQGGAKSDSPIAEEEDPKASEQHPEIEAAVKKLKAPTLGEVRTNATLLRFGGFQDNTEYFGDERGAEEFFKKEKAAKAEDLEIRTYPVVVEVGLKEHWMCA